MSNLQFHCTDGKSNSTLETENSKSTNLHFIAKIQPVSVHGLTENDEHQNGGPSKLQYIKFMD